MAMLAVPLMIAGTVMSAAGQLRQGQAEKQVADYNAGVMRTAAGQERAASQREAQDTRRQLGIAQSNLLAAAAAGGDASSPGFADLVGDLEREGELRAQMKLFEGEDRARGLESKANLTQYEGKMAKRNATTKAFSTLLEGGGKTLYAKYGGGGFGGDDDEDTPPARRRKPSY